MWISMIVFFPTVRYNEKWGENMKRRGLSQEGLKSIACITMLIDHIGAAFVYNILSCESDPVRWAEFADLYYTMRIIGRIAFPIYCFLLVEGAHHTRNPKKYAGRLAVGVLLSEIPFDLALNGGFDWLSNSVMITLLLGYLMILSMNRLRGLWKYAVILPFFLAAEWLWTDYGGNGVLIIAMLALTKGLRQEMLWRALGFCLVLSFGPPIALWGVEIPMELFGLFALVPIFCYDGTKCTHSKAVQWAFYLFYPVHLLLIWVVQLLT